MQSPPHDCEGNSSGSAMADPASETCRSKPWTARHRCPVCAARRGRCGGCSYVLLLFHLQHDCDRLNDLLVRIGFAIDDDLVQTLLCSLWIEKVFFCKPVIPAAVPHRQSICVFLIGPCQMLAGKFLHVGLAIGIRVCGQRHKLKAACLPGACCASRSSNKAIPEGALIRSEQ
jgi:hypothetical protein